MGNEVNYTFVVDNYNIGQNIFLPTIFGKLRYAAPPCGRNVVDVENKKRIQFISIFIVFRNPRVNSFFLLLLFHLQQGRMRQAKRHAFSSRRDALQDGQKGRRDT